jgi:ABC-type protease/lipase transport system fused ATPase/permease subunit
MLKIDKKTKLKLLINFYIIYISSFISFRGIEVFLTLPFSYLFFKIIFLAIGIVFFLYALVVFELTIELLFDSWKRRGFKK